KAFVRGSINIREARLVKRKLTKAASDHLPLVIDFHLEQPSPTSNTHQPDAPHISYSTCSR
ncbi:MAG: hypothetical protein KDA78_12025, partial [Planctomycetaceae bacterium]|nr:hypothetical protein [Planctomycetaceae bacterium]